MSGQKKNMFGTFLNYLIGCETIIGGVKVLPEERNRRRSNCFCFRKFFSIRVQRVQCSPLEKAANLVQLVVVSVRCNLGRDPPGLQLFVCIKRFVISEESFSITNLQTCSASPPPLRSSGKRARSWLPQTCMQRENMMVVVKEAPQDNRNKE